MTEETTGIGEAAYAYRFEHQVSWPEMAQHFAYRDGTAREEKALLGAARKFARSRGLAWPPSSIVATGWLQAVSHWSSGFLRSNGDMRSCVSVWWRWRHG